MWKIASSSIFAMFCYLIGVLATCVANATTKYISINNMLTTSEIVMMKSLLSVLLLLPFNCRHVLETKTRNKIRENILLLFAIGVATLISQFATLISQFTWINAIKRMPLNNVFLCVMTISPMMTAIGGKIFFKENISNRIKFAFAINIFAIFLINKFVFNKIAWNIGYLFLLCDLLVYSVIILITRKLRELPSGLIVFVRFLVVLPFSIITVRHFPTLTFAVAFLTLIVAMSCTLGRFLQTKSYKYLEVSIVQPLRYFDIVFTIFISFIILEEKPTLYQILGTIIIIASGFIVASGKNKVN